MVACSAQDHKSLRSLLEHAIINIVLLNNPHMSTHISIKLYNRQIELLTTATFETVYDASIRNLSLLSKKR